MDNTKAGKKVPPRNSTMTAMTVVIIDTPILVSIIGMLVMITAATTIRPRFARILKTCATRAMKSTAIGLSCGRTQLS